MLDTLTTSTNTAESHADHTTATRRRLAATIADRAAVRHRLGDAALAAAALATGLALALAVAVATVTALATVATTPAAQALLLAVVLVTVLVVVPALTLRAVTRLAAEAHYRY